jgi:hypothetical protein
MRKEDMRKEDPISANSQVTDNSDPREAKSSATKRITLFKQYLFLS